MKRVEGKVRQGIRIARGGEEAERGGERAGDQKEEGRRRFAVVTIE